MVFDYQSGKSPGIFICVLGMKPVRFSISEELAGPFRKLKMSTPAHTHQFKKLRSSSKCKKCDSLVYFNGAECELVCVRLINLSMVVFKYLWMLRWRKILTITYYVYGELLAYVQTGLV